MSAKESLLAGYDDVLKHEFGLFALEYSGNDDIQETINFFLDANLRPFDAANVSENTMAQGDFWDLFGYQIDALTVTPKHNLSDLRVLEKQILEFMRFRAPLRAAERLMPAGTQNQTAAENQMGQIVSFADLLAAQPGNVPKIGLPVLYLEKVNALSNIGSAGNATRLKTEIDRELLQLGQDFSRVHDEIALINTFCKNTFAVLMDEIAVMIEEYSDMLYIAYEQELSDEDINAINAARQALIGKISNVESEIINLIGANNNARSILESSKVEFANAEGKIDRFGEHLELNKDSLALVYEEMREAYDYYQSINIEGLAELTESFEINEKALDRSRDHLEDLKNMIDALEGMTPQERSGRVLSISQEIESQSSFLSKAYVNYANFKIYPTRVEDGLAMPEDPREEKAESASNDLDDITAERGHKKALGEIPADIFSKFPSRLPTDEAGSDDSRMRIEIGTIEFDENKTGFFDRVLGDAGNILGGMAGLQTESADLLNAFLITEYITGIFRSRITLEEPKSVEQTTGADTQRSFNENLRRDEKIVLPLEVNPFLDYEMEYILFGGMFDSLNLGFAVAGITAVRFASNFIYVSTDKGYLATASKIAAAAAIKSTIGAPLVYPLIKAKVLASFALHYSMMDMKALLSGYEVPVFKRKPAMTMNYEEYLYSFLLVASLNSRNVLLRTYDLIQLNVHLERLRHLDLESLDFRFIEFYTYFDTQANISIRNIFLNILGQTERVGFTDRARHDFNVKVMDGY